MSATDLHHDTDPRHVHGHDEPHDDHHSDELPHATFRGYVIGFLASVILTAIPFWLVMADVLPSRGLTTALILVFAVLQMLVHVVFFLHLDSRSQGGWNLLAAIFTIVLVVIAIAGSLWVMFHMNTNMMPMAPHEMRNVP
jgi:cytochrome o ubiquinol oxidase operon protein cyoD